MSKLPNPAKNKNAGDRLLRKSEVAELLCVSMRSVDRMVLRGHLPRVLLGTIARFRASDVTGIMTTGVNQVSVRA